MKKSYTNTITNKQKSIYHLPSHHDSAWCQVAFFPLSPELHQALHLPPPGSWQWACPLCCWWATSTTAASVDVEIHGQQREAPSRAKERETCAMSQTAHSRLPVEVPKQLAVPEIAAVNLGSRSWSTTHGTPKSRASPKTYVRKYHSRLKAQKWCWQNWKECGVGYRWQLNLGQATVKDIDLG